MHEKRLLAGILRRPAIFAEVAAKVSTGDFQNACCADIYHVMRCLHAEKSSIDANRLNLASLIDHPELEEPETARVMAEIIKSKPDKDIWRADLRQLVDEARRRRIERGEALEPAAPPAASIAELTALDQVPPQAVRWLWPGRIAVGKLTLLVGGAGTGKTLVGLDLAARVSRGLAWPLDAEPAPQGSVIVVNRGDDLADTIRPRLEAAGADLGKVVALTHAPRPNAARGEDLRIDLERDWAALDAAIARTADCRLVIVDTIGSCLETPAACGSPPVRQLTARLAELAQRRTVAVLAMNTAGEQGSARALGNQPAAWTALAVAVDPHDRRQRALVALKNNQGELAGLLAFELEGDRVAWRRAEPQLDVEELLARPTQWRGDRREAMLWLHDFLADGPVASSELLKAAREAGFSRRTLHRAKRAMGFGSRQTADGWFWDLDVAHMHSPRMRHATSTLPRRLGQAVSEEQGAAGAAKGRSP